MSSGQGQPSRRPLPKCRLSNSDLPSSIVVIGTSVAAVATDPGEGVSEILDRLDSESEIRRRLLDYCRDIDIGTKETSPL